MQKTKSTVKGATKPITIRLDHDVEQFYRRKANEHGVALSEFLRQTLVQGVIAENVQEIEQRLRGLVDEIRLSGQTGGRAGIPDELLLSVFMSEHLLTAIVEARDIQKLYEAQDAAQARLAELKGGGDGKT